MAIPPQLMDGRREGASKRSSRFMNPHLGYSLIKNHLSIMMTKVLFICVHNSARSQMAEAFLNHHCPEHFLAQSAGLEPGTLNPLVVRVMNEKGIDISGKGTQGVFELFKAGRLFSHVISVCDEANAERCPIFPSFAKRHRWSFPDPSAVTGDEEERLEKIRVIRDSIEAKIKDWCEERCKAPDSD